MSALDTVDPVEEDEEDEAEAAAAAEGAPIALTRSNSMTISQWSVLGNRSTGIAFKGMNAVPCSFLLSGPQSAVKVRRRLCLGIGVCAW